MIVGYSGSTGLAFSCIMVPSGCGYSTALQHYFRLQSEDEREEKKKKSCNAVRCYFNLGSFYVL